MKMQEKLSAWYGLLEERRTDPNLHWTIGPHAIVFKSDRKEYVKMRYEFEKGTFVSIGCNIGKEYGRPHWRFHYEPK